MLNCYFEFLFASLCLWFSNHHQYLKTECYEWLLIAAYSVLWYDTIQYDAIDTVRYESIMYFTYTKRTDSQLKSTASGQTKNNKKRN